MKTSKTLTVLCLLLIAQGGFAQSDKSLKAIQPLKTDTFDKETIKQAMQIVLQSGAITSEPKKGIRLNRNLIEEMRAEGMIRQSDGVASSICIDPIK